MILLFTILYFQASAQQLSSITQDISEKFTKYQETYRSEKIYLHTDKSNFTSGEDIWFKVYLVDAKTHLFSNLSSLVYVELIDTDQQKVISSRNIRMISGNGIGDIKIPEIQPSGKLLLRAYTNFMRNFDEGFFYEQEVGVINLGQTPEDGQISLNTTPKNNAKPLQVQFFPEGGDLVDQLVNAVAFKAIDPFGKGVSVKGQLLDDQGKEVNQIETQKFGLGKFLIIPEPGRKYTAMIDYQGKTYRFNLPKSKAQGFTLNVKSNSEYVIATVKSSQNQSVKSSFFLVHTRGHLLTTYQIQDDKNYFILSIPRDQIPTGITHFTFFDQNGTPQCERLYFVDNSDNQQVVNVKPNKKSFKDREKASFDVNITDREGKPITGNFSVSILNKTFVTAANLRTDIQNYLLMSSDLRGDIESPGYYFNPNHEDRLKMLDLVMLTHGWRRFKWDEVLGEVPASLAYEHENGFEFSGQLFQFYNRKKKVAGEVKLNFLENFGFNESVQSDEEGRFTFKGLHIQDSITVLLQANKLNAKKGKSKEDERNREIYIQLDQKNKPSLPKKEMISTPEENTEKQDNYSAFSKKVNTINAAYGLEEDVTLLDEIEIRGQRETREKTKYDRPGQLYSSPTNRLVLDSIGGSSAATNFFDFIRGKLPGVQVSGSFPNFSVNIRQSASINLSTEPLYLLNGAPVDITTVANLNMSDVSHVDVLKGAQTVMYGSRGVNGVLAVYTKITNDYKPVEKDRVGIINFKHAGYYTVREFYTPNYDKPDESHRKPDFRRTLYWNPYVPVSEGKANFEFYTSDEKSMYLIDIQGLTNEGKVIKGVYEMEVK